MSMVSPKQSDINISYVATTQNMEVAASDPAVQSEQDGEEILRNRTLKWEEY